MTTQQPNALAAAYSAMVQQANGQPGGAPPAATAAPPQSQFEAQPMQQQMPPQQFAQPMQQQGWAMPQQQMMAPPQGVPVYSPQTPQPIGVSVRCQRWTPAGKATIYFEYGPECANPQAIEQILMDLHAKQVLDVFTPKQGGGGGGGWGGNSRRGGW